MADIKGSIQYQYQAPDGLTCERCVSLLAHLRVLRDAR